MVNARVPLDTDDGDELTGARVKWIRDPDLKRRTPGSMTLVPPARQKPSRHGARRGDGEGRQERGLLHARRSGHLSRQGREGRHVARAYPLSRPAPAPRRRRDRLSAGGARRGQLLLPTRQRPRREGRHDPRPPTAASRNGATSSATRSSRLPCSTGCSTTPWSSRSRARAIGSASTPTSSPSTCARKPSSPRRPSSNVVAGRQERRTPIITPADHRTPSEPVQPRNFGRP